MRTHGWDGSPPPTDDAARRRIIDATMRCIGRYGHEKTSLSDVATEVGVTRRTIYRYFPSTEALLAEAGLAATDDFFERLMEAVGEITDPTDALVEAAAFAVEELPHDLYAGVLLAGSPHAFAKEALSSGARAAADGVLDRMAFDWDQLLLVDREQLAELILRLVQSFVLDPGDPPFTGERLRTFLRCWIAPIVTT